MKQALIDPTTQVKALTAWIENPDKREGAPAYLPVWTTIENSARVAQVGTSFPVATPLFWVNCADDVVSDKWYYDTQTQIITVVPSPVPQPVAGTV